MSIWSGSSSDSWVDSDRLAKYRLLLKVERKAEFRKVSPDQFYTISVDVGRYDANTVICVFKNLPQDLWFKKCLVNILLFFMRIWDKHNNKRIDYFIANSSEIQRRVKAFRKGTK